MNKKLRLSALLMIYLVITLTFYTNFVFAQRDPAEACIEKAEKSSGLADIMDNGIIKFLETIFSIGFFITTVMNTIDFLLSILDSLIGSNEPGCLCSIPLGQKVCGALDGVMRGWRQAFQFVRPLTCFISCEWCQGKSCWESEDAEDSVLGMVSQIPTIGDIGAVGIGKPGAATITEEFGISPYDNIYTAIGCLCPGAILFNLRKLKTIYDTHSCCVQEACTNGLETTQCDAFLSEATCMYWEGSLYLMLVKVLFSVVSRILTEYILKDIIGQSIWGNCLRALFDILRVPSVISGLKDAFELVSQRFDEPDCKDLGFDNIKEKGERDYVDGILIKNERLEKYDVIEVKKEEKK